MNPSAIICHDEISLECSTRGMISTLMVRALSQRVEKSAVCEESRGDREAPTRKNTRTPKTCLRS